MHPAPVNRSVEIDDEAGRTSAVAHFPADGERRADPHGRHRAGDARITEAEQAARENRPHDRREGRRAQAREAILSHDIMDCERQTSGKMKPAMLATAHIRIEDGDDRRDRTGRRAGARPAPR